MRSVKSGDNVVVALPEILLESDGSIPISPLQWYIKKISHSVAKLFVETWHYSGRMPTGKNINFGLFYGSALYAVIVYGIGVNPYQARYIGIDACIEIKRMCRTEPRREYQLSCLINLTTKMARREMPFQAVVAFADPQYGHEGIVYKGAGFTHMGMTAAEWHLVDSTGITRHRRFAYRMARRNGISVSEARELLGVSRIKTLPKHRWVRYV